MFEQKKITYKMKLLSSLAKVFQDEEPVYRTLLTDTLKAAVKAGTDAGTVQLVLDNQVLAEWKVEAAESIAKRDYIWCLRQLMMQFTHMNKINQ